ERMDPQQRLALEVAWEALEHAAIAPDSLRGVVAGVYLGMVVNEYALLRARSSRPEDCDIHVATGNSFNAAAGRISYLLGLRGPALAVDTACSSSLTAVHLACRALRGGECELALAGGVSLMVVPDGMIALSSAGALAPDGRCKTFDDGADGFSRAEGCGVVVLQRLSTARAQGRTVLALIRGSAVNQDGASSGLTVPTGEAQEQVLRAALADAGLEAKALSYVEAHGTGTRLGDPIELGALARVFTDAPLWVGSIKTNFGHTEGAAGVAGLIKATLALRRRQIPAHLHLRKPTAEFDWARAKLRVPVTLEPWDGDAPRRAGISSFGISGTNAHVIVEEAPEPTNPTVATDDAPRSSANASPSRASSSASSPSASPILVLSARSPEALRAQARAWAPRLKTQPLDALARTAALGRAHLEHRLAFVGDDAERGAEALRRFAAGADEVEAIVHGHGRPGEGRLAFVFPGQGGQWVGMSRSLRREPAFAEALSACAAALVGELPCGLEELLDAPDSDPRWARIDLLQPAIFAVQVALARQWQAWGVEPAALVGHSMGEVAAAVIAGGLRLEDGAAVIARRSRLLARISGRGAMAVIERSADQLELLLRERPLLALAVINGPETCVVSGDTQELAALVGALEADGVFCRHVKVDVASHSPQVDELEAPLLAALRGLEPLPPTIELCSTVAGGALERPLDAGYWWDNLRAPVRFWAVLRGLAERGFTRFVEISPHPVLAPAIDRGLAALARAGRAFASTRREQDEVACMRETLGALHVGGASIDWRRAWGSTGPLASAPTYPWQRRPHWLPLHPPATTHLLGPRVELPDDPRVVVWPLSLDLEGQPWLGEHRIAGAPLLSVATSLALLWTAARSLLGDGASLQACRFTAPAVLGGALEAQLIARREGEGWMILLRTRADGGWREHASAQSRRTATPSLPALAGLAGPAVDAPRSGDALYARLADWGVELGPSLTLITSLTSEPQDDSRAGPALRAALRWPLGAEAGLAIPAPLLDACVQALGAAMTGERLRDAGIELLSPEGLDALEVIDAQRPLAHGPALGCRAVLDPDSSPAAMRGDVVLFDGAGEPRLRLRGLSLRGLGPDPRGAVRELRLTLSTHALAAAPATLRAGPLRIWGALQTL
ncbi:MAG: type I polyketide synthase, partial [Myxococcales bacterium]|nr:type I polyketide synthase [Myxococcales bacterium]